MPLQLQRITLPRGPSSLAQVTQSRTHVLVVDHSGPSLLVDVSGKKPVVHELPNLILEGQGTDPGTSLCTLSGAFSADGTRLVLLRAGTDRNGGRKPALEVIDPFTRQLVSSRHVTIERPWGVGLHPNGEHLIVMGTPVTLVLDAKGKAVERIGTDQGFAMSPSGARMLFQSQRSTWRVRPTDKPKFVEFEAAAATWRDDDTLLATTWTDSDDFDLNLVDAKTGKAKKLATLPRLDAFEAFGELVLASSCKGKKAEAFVISLPSGKVQRFELPGSPSGTQVSLGPAGAFVAVNWQRGLHVLAGAVAAVKQPMPKKAAAPAKQQGDFVRYELAQKFWAVRLDGSAFTVRFGKQGTDGQQQVKSFANAAAAKKAFDALVASKVKKGYRAV